MTPPPLGAASADLAGANANAGAERLRGLLAAHRLIAADLDLPTMLERITAAACDLVGAGHGVLGVLGADGVFEQLIRHGVGAPGRPDPLPLRGHGDRLEADLPPGDSARGDQLGKSLAVPINVGDTAFGDLFLAEPATGRFSADDADLVATLAALAGSAIHNARLYRDAQRSAAWLRASGDIARALLRNADVDMLAEVLDQALAAGEADFGALIVPTAAGQLQVLSTAGLGAEDYVGRVFDPDASPLAAAIAAGATSVFADVADWSRIGFANPRDLGPAMIAPLIDADGLRGAVLLMRSTGRLAFGRHDVESATTFAAHVALALQFDNARADAAWVAVLEDRQRIGRDLHDNVMQRLFATGIGLQVLAGQQGTPETAARVQRHIAELDETIDEIRTRVFTLSDNGVPSGSESHRVVESDTVSQSVADNQSGRRRFPSSPRESGHHEVDTQPARSDLDDRSASAGHPHLPTRRP